MTNDILSDMLTRLRNASLARHLVVQVPATNVTRGLTEILLEEGFLQHFEEVGSVPHTRLLLSLRYRGKCRQPVITSMKRISKPGLRVYANRRELPRVLGGLGIAIISTSQGIMTDTKARHLGLGGEILCYVW
uniref:Ribosomal protein S8 n=1 Tax=Cryptomonas sp. CCAC 1634B TaxID=2051848 RepID=A0A679CAF6_9CRYP|nr:ribosomal protein S8 [Cryptomonas sp. CCAC 1634B]